MRSESGIGSGGGHSEREYVVPPLEKPKKKEKGITSVEAALATINRLTNPANQWGVPLDAKETAEMEEAEAYLLAQGWVKKDFGDVVLPNKNPDRDKFKQKMDAKKGNSIPKTEKVPEKKIVLPLAKPSVSEENTTPHKKRSVAKEAARVSEARALVQAEGVEESEPLVKKRDAHHHDPIAEAMKRLIKDAKVLEMQSVLKKRLRPVAPGDVAEMSYDARRLFALDEGESVATEELHKRYVTLSRYIRADTTGSPDQLKFLEQSYELLRADRTLRALDTYIKQGIQTGVKIEFPGENQPMMISRVDVAQGRVYYEEPAGFLRKLFGRKKEQSFLLKDVPDRLAFLEEFSASLVGPPFERTN